MAKCNFCTLDMSDDNVKSCVGNQTIINGKEYMRNTQYHDVNDRCHDCNIVNGNIHHYGCDMERCPSCDDQFMCCGCKIESVGNVKLV